MDRKLGGAKTIRRLVTSAPWKKSKTRVCSADLTGSCAWPGSAASETGGPGETAGAAAVEKGTAWNGPIFDGCALAAVDSLSPVSPFVSALPQGLILPHLEVRRCFRTLAECGRRHGHSGRQAEGHRGGSDREVPERFARGPDRDEPLRVSSLLSLTFGIFFFDYDLDGMLDIFAANGHIEDEIKRVQPKVQYREAPLLFRNVGNGRFESVGESMGKDFNRPIVARSAAYADFDHAGDLDVLMTTNQGPAYQLRNDGGNRNHWLWVWTVGARSNRDGNGAVVRIVTAAGPQWSTVRSGSSYCSASELIQPSGWAVRPR